MARLLVLTLVFVGLPHFQTQESQRYSFREPHMGTQIQLLIYSPSEEMAKKAAAAAFDRVKQLDDIMSDYRPTSELMRLCARAGGDPVPVSTELFTVLQKANLVSRLSGGAFDVTVGPVVRLWRIARRTKQLPDSEKLAAARSLIGWQQIHLDEINHTVKLDKKGILLDLGGIGKGYAMDEVQKVLRQHGITRSLVSAGGDVVADDPPPGTDGWKVAIYPLEPEKDQPVPELLLKNAAISSSGDLQQFVEIDGVRYSHLVDPRTGLGLVGRMSATVLAPTGIQADSMTKVLAILGAEKGLPLLENLPGVSGRLALQTDRGITVAVSRRFPKPR